MRRRFLAAFFFYATVLPAVAGQLGFDDARHLLNRTGFAANIPEIQAFSQLSRSAAVDRLLGWTEKTALVPAPEWAHLPYAPPPRLKELSDEARKDYQREVIGQGRDLRAWWMAQMLTTTSPLTEKMVLFWHNHFVSSLRKVRMPLLMYRQHLTLRQHALGSFRDMLHVMARDPAMLIYLDGAANRKGKPNENFAREVMELFTLGEGHYSEQDVKEVARAFTGWSIDRETGEFMFRAFLHDTGNKTVLGVTGALDGTTVLDTLLGRPETAEFIVTKLWREFVSAEPDRREVRRIAAVFRASRYDIRLALRELLISDSFYDRPNRASLVKSPVDLVVGTLRQFRMTVDDPLPFAMVAGRLGQDLFAPPNVRGWPGGEAWINSTTLLSRKQFLDMVFRGSDPGMQRTMRGAQFEGDAWFGQFGGAPDRWQRVVFAGQPVAIVTGQGIEALRVAVQDPAFQLK